MPRPKYTPEQFAEAFWSKVDKSAGPDGCWPWTGAIDPTGYGRVRRGGKLVSTHRVAYELANGPIPPDKPCVCHHCDNRPCCNPACLFAGTNADNVADMVSKGRGSSQRGQAHSHAKLTEADIPNIMAARNAGETYRAVGERYGVSAVAVWYAVNRVTWKHVAID